MSTDTTPTDRPPLVLVIHAYSAETGHHVEVSLSLTAERITEACKRLQAAGLVASPPSTTQAHSSAQSNGKGKAQKAELFADDGTPLCPAHGRMREGKHGWFCPHKDDDGAWCKIRA